MPGKTYAASYQVYRYFNVETGECISAYCARRLPRGKVKVETLRLAVKSKTPMEMKHEILPSLPFQILIAAGRRLNQMLLRSKKHINPLVRRQKEAILQQAAEMAKNFPLSTKHYPHNNGLFAPPHVPAAVPKKSVKGNTAMMVDTQ